MPSWFICEAYTNGGRIIRRGRFAITADDWKKRNEGDFQNINPTEGNCCIEIWQYPSIPINEHFVDMLSLAISLQDDHDPRVEKEVELMIEKLW